MSECFDLYRTDVGRSTDLYRNGLLRQSIKDGDHSFIQYEYSTFYWPKAPQKNLPHLNKIKVEVGNYYLSEQTQVFSVFKYKHLGTFESIDEVMEYIFVQSFEWFL